MEYDKTYTFDSFLEKIGISIYDYIHAIQCTSRQRIIFLKREPVDIWTNIFAQHIPLMWGANTDAQFVLDSYATTNYYCSYMKNIDKTMTSRFKHM